MKFAVAAKQHKEYKFGKKPVPDDGIPLSPDQPQYSLVKALQRSSHEVCLFTLNGLDPRNDVGEGTTGVAHKIHAGLTRLTRATNRALNRFRFRRWIEKEKPDVVLLQGGQELLSHKTVRQARNEAGVPFAMMHGLPPPDHVSDRDVKIANIVDVVLVSNIDNVQRWEDLGATQAEQVPVMAADLEMHGRVKRNVEEPLCDVGFVGSFLPKSRFGHRIGVLKALASYDLGIWSVDGKSVLESEGLGSFYRGPVTRSGCPEIYARTKIMVNIQARRTPRGSNLSTFEIPASGGFQLVSGVTEGFFEEDEVVVFDGVEDLKKKIDYFLENEAEREDIAAGSRKRVLSDHTFESRIEKLATLVEEIR